jgi:hypothetical protein
MFVAAAVLLQLLQLLKSAGACRILGIAGYRMHTDRGKGQLKASDSSACTFARLVSGLTATQHAVFGVRRWLPTQSRTEYYARWQRTKS